MNERIKQLERQAIIGVLKGNDPDRDVDRMYISAEFTKKFAELIIEECVSISNIERDNSVGCGYVTQTIGQRIRKHFGVEK